MAVVFDSQPPFYAPLSKHYLVRCGGVSSRESGQIVGGGLVYDLANPWNMEDVMGTND
jgi:hypothetical protein